MPKFKQEDLDFLPDEQIDLSCPHPFNGRKLFKVAIKEKRLSVTTLQVHGPSTTNLGDKLHEC
jgi:hypothetical protein